MDLIGENMGKGLVVDVQDEREISLGCRLAVKPDAKKGWYLWLVVKLLI
jgi:hypothetical protein